MLHAKGLHKRFGKTTALAGLNLRINPGEVVGLIGHNGAGKSTFVNIAAGLERPDAGSISIAGTDITREPRLARSKLGLAPQHLALYLTATGQDNLKLFGALGGLRGARLRRRIEEVAAAMGLTTCLDKAAGTLSGGQQKRLQTASALLHDPPVLLLDEPTVGADVEARQALLSVVRGLADDGAAICYTTHYLGELDELDATLAILANGRMIARGARADLLAGLPSTLRLSFVGEPAQVTRGMWRAHLTPEGDMAIPTDNPADELARVIRSLGDDAQALTDVAIDKPGLDDLYRHLVIERDHPAREAEDVH